ncbi:MAG: hypothetical protein IIZ78_10510 [Clostridiales bacterium]|jgi:hypothetical protein|nr:hypothetical protein [Clostridiales bacterium]
MEFTFQNLIDLLANNLFGGSSTLAGLALMLAMWAVFAVICLAMRAPPVYTIVPLIPISIFFTAYGLLNETIMIIIVLVSSVLVAAEFKKVVD